MSLMGPDGQPLDQQAAAGLVGPDGRPIGPQTDTAGPMAGLRWGVAFLILDGNILAVHPLVPDDVVLVDVPVGDGLPPQQWVGMKGRPKPDGEHRFVRGWGEAPGIMAGMLAAHMTTDLERDQPTEEPSG